MLSMAKKIYVGNMSYNTSEEDLRDLFAQYGTVLSANIIIDRETRRPKGFAFVEMEEDSAAAAAISQLDGKDLDGRNLRVNEAIAKPRPAYNNYRD
jgi:RNA recognition motif-containing protein